MFLASISYVTHHIIVDDNSAKYYNITSSIVRQQRDAGVGGERKRES